MQCFKNIATILTSKSPVSSVRLDFLEEFIIFLQTISMTSCKLGKGGMD